MTIDALAQELACLHRQVTLRQACPHRPRHQDLASAIVCKYAAGSPPEVQARIRAACRPREKRSTD